MHGRIYVLVIIYAQSPKIPFMACVNPRLMACIDLNKYPLLRPRFQELGWKISQTDNKAYRLVSKETRDIVLEKVPDYVEQKVFEIPCGGCVACRLNYSKDWANRCSLESSLYNDNYFITLTYDDEHLVYGDIGNPTLKKEHFTKFIKDLRQVYRLKFDHKGIRYFGCGEYGDKYNRPHGHIIFFNLPIDDLSIDFPQPDGTIIRKKEKMTGKFYFYSELIQSLWPYGYVVIADCNWNTEAYVSRYIMKKQKGNNGKIYKDKLGIEPPYLFMSNRPGIGTEKFLDNYIGYLAEPYMIVSRPYKPPLISGLPRAFKKKIKEDDPKIYNQMVDLAKENLGKSNSLLHGIQLINDNRANIESNIISKAKSFVRDFE